MQLLSQVISILFVVWIAFLPVYLWGYAGTRLLDTDLNPRRFWIGMVLGGLSVGLLHFLSQRDLDGSIWVIGILFAILMLVVWLMVRSGAVVARGMLERLTLANSLTMIVTILVVYGVSKIFDNEYLLLTMIPLLFASLFEESSKHLMSVALMSHDFRFSRRDILLFTLYVVLGFIFVENLLYLWVGHISLPVWMFRSVLTFSVHLIASSICALAWWQALSYPPFSWRYILIFLTGFVIAVLVHTGYNSILSSGSIIGLILYLIIGYLIITRAILREKVTH